MSDWQDHYLGAVPAAPGTKGPDGRTVVAWVIDSTDTAIAVYSPFMAAPAKATAAPAKAAEPAPVTGEYGIERTDKQYVKQSFWRFRDAGADFLFIVEPNTDTPRDERVQKITRDEFYELRKSVAVVTYAQLFDPAVTSSGPAEEPPGDDADDLI